jgi:hypothetical protein
MSYFLFASTERELDQDTIDKLKTEKINIRNYSGKVRDGKIGHFYYEISNELSLDKENISPYNRIDEVEDALENLHEKGNFRMLLINSESEQGYLEKIEEGEFEKTIEHFPQEKIDLDETLERYPQKIEANRIYIVD